MSYITLADLGRRGRGGGGRRWGGGGWYGGGYPYPYYDGSIYPSPIVVIDPVDSQNPEEAAKAKAEADAAAEKAKIQAIAAVVREELAKQKGLGQSGMFIDVMGPGARDSEIDVEARDDEVIDEAVSSQQALLYRQQAGLVDQRPMMIPAPGMSDDPVSAAGAPAAPGAKRVGKRSGGGGAFGIVKRCGVAAGVSMLAGAAIGYFLASRKETK